jgi:threonine dehydrogenase-like Zn-dependent dehydrogenase
VAVFGCGPVGQFAIASARLLGAGRVFAIDNVPSRLSMARAQGAETINFDQEDPVALLKELTLGIGVDRAIDAVGVDANRAHSGPAAEQPKAQRERSEKDRATVAPDTNPVGDNWHPGDAPAQALIWAVDALAKAGTLSIIGVYPEAAMTFPIGKAMNKNLTLKMGNCNHRRYMPTLIEAVRSGRIDPTSILTHTDSLTSAIEAYRAFDRRLEGWTKVELLPSGDGAQRQERVASA